jgi:hypothetical protein
VLLPPIIRYHPFIHIGLIAHALVTIFVVSPTTLPKSFGSISRIAKTVAPERATLPLHAFREGLPTIHEVRILVLP